MSAAIARLTDIVEAIDLIPEEMRGMTLADLAADKRKRWLIERGLEISSEASRKLPDDMKARHSEIPWRKVAGIGNVVRHEYQRVAHDLLWRLVRDDLSRLETACRSELAAAIADGQQ